MDCHVRVDFGIAGVPVLHYRAEESAAETFACELHRLHPAYAVAIDHTATDGLAELPCHNLFLPDSSPRHPGRHDLTPPR